MKPQPTPQPDFGFVAEVFNLGTESGVDGARVQAESDKRAQDKADADALQQALIGELACEQKCSISELGYFF